MSEGLTLEYVPLNVAAGWDWIENAKEHDIGGLVQSIKEYGFRDPPEFDATLGAFAQGNGRVKALAMMFKQGEERPKYIGDEDGFWVVPVLFGADSKSVAAAQAYAIDTNNLVLTGGDTEVWDILALYDRQQLAEITVGLEASNQGLVTLDSESIALIGGPTDGQEPTGDPDRRERWVFHVEFEGSQALLEELCDLMGPYFVPRSRRKLMPEFFVAMARAYCGDGQPVIIQDVEGFVCSHIQKP